MIESVRINLNVEQANEIRRALEDKIASLKRCQDRCRVLEIEVDNPIFTREYSKMIVTYQEWIDHVSAVLEHVKCEAGELMW